VDTEQFAIVCEECGRRRNAALPAKTDTERRLFPWTPFAGVLNWAIMRIPVRALIPLLIASTCASARAQYKAGPAQKAEIEAAYTLAIDKRAAAIITALDLKDAAKVARVTDVLTNQYRSLRRRDEMIETRLKSATNEPAGANLDRADLFRTMSKPLHEEFLSKLAADLSPQQIEIVKDKMTYNKVRVTYDAYCAIIPGLIETDKTKIMEELKLAREEAIDGGSADEKSAIFKKYKDRINEYLNAHGHDVAKAYKDWNAKQELAKKNEEKK